MKKLIILLALMLVSLSAAGCGNSDQQADDPSADTESKAKRQPENLKVKISN